MLTTDGLEYDITGDGESVLLIHGGAIAVTFVPMTWTPSMADRFRLIRYNRRGFAGSPPLAEAPVSGQTYASLQVADALSVLQAAGVDRAHVIGHSGGGWVGVQMALDAPSVVQSLVLMEPAIYAMKESWRTASYEALGELFDLYEADTEAAARALLAGVEGRDWRTFAASLPGGPEAWIRDTIAMFFEFRLVLDWKFGATEASRITQPLLYITGGNSPPYLEDVKALFAQWVPQTEVAVIAGEGHNMFTQRPEPAASVIADFLLRHPMR